jgi:hypothetical protein
MQVDNTFVTPAAREQIGLASELAEMMEDKIQEIGFSEYGEDDIPQYTTLDLLDDLASAGLMLRRLSKGNEQGDGFSDFWSTGLSHVSEAYFALLADQSEGADSK